MGESVRKLGEPCSDKIRASPPGARTNAAVATRDDDGLAGEVDREHHSGYRNSRDVWVVSSFVVADGNESGKKEMRSDVGRGSIVAALHPLGCPSHPRPSPSFEARGGVA